MGNELTKRIVGELNEICDSEERLGEIEKGIQQSTPSPGTPQAPLFYFLTVSSKEEN